MQLNATLLKCGLRTHFVAAILAASAFIGPAQAASDASWLDVEGRIQYSFYTEDARALSDISHQLSQIEGDQDSLQRYYVGLANYRLALLLATRDKARAQESAQQCVDNLGAAVKAQNTFAAGYALHAACLRTLSALTPWKPLAGSKSTGQMERAVKLAPRDPRVLLLNALSRGEDGKFDEQSLTILKKAAEAFESERQGMDRTPGWGAAEAYTYLGRGYLERGDVLNARDALERALLIAPDFAMARRLMTKITTG